MKRNREKKVLVKIGKLNERSDKGYPLGYGRDDILVFFCPRCLKYLELGRYSSEDREHYFDESDILFKIHFTNRDTFDNHVKICKYKPKSEILYKSEGILIKRIYDKSYIRNISILGAYFIPHTLTCYPDSRHMLYVISSEQDGLIGYLLAYDTVSQGSKAYKANAILILPSYQRQGFGTLLYKEILKSLNSPLYPEAPNEIARQMMRKMGVSKYFPAVM